MLYRQPGWRFCVKCRGYFFGPGPAGVCPADHGQHDPSSSGAYVTMNESMSVVFEGFRAAEEIGRENNWAYCRLCSGLFFRDNTQQACPSGGAHDASTSGAYWVLYQSPRIDWMTAGYQLGWARCSDCAAMFFTQDGSQGACPGNHGAGHVADGTHDYALLAGYDLDEPDDSTLLVVATVALAAAVEPLVAHRVASGVTARQVTLGACVTHNGGSDDAARLREAITYATQYLGTRYVLLVGDASMIPVRYRYIHWDPTPGGLYWRNGSYAPTDLYYASLYGGHVRHPDGSVTHGPEGNWDANGDGLFDEQVSGNQYTNNPDQIDGFVDVAVGRLPTSDPSGVARYVAKLIAFENGSARSFDQTLGIVADANYAPDTEPDIARLSALADLSAPRWPRVERIWFNGSSTQPTPAGYRMAQSGETIAPTLARSSWVVYLGHGNYSAWDVPGSDRASVALQRAANVPVVMGIGCQTGQIANFAPDGPGGYLDTIGQRHLYGVIPDGVTTTAAATVVDWGAGEPSDTPVQQWRLAETGAIDAARPNVYQPTLDRPTVAAEWLHAQQDGGTVAYFGEQTVGPDSPGAELVGRMLAAAAAEGAHGQTLGDLWLLGCCGYWVDFHADPDFIDNARIYLSYMTLYGDPSLRL